MASTTDGPPTVPVVLFTGPVGVGKTTVAMEAARLLGEAQVPHALIDLAWTAVAWPAPRDDPWNERLLHRNLACLWSNFHQAGAERLILCRVLEDRSVLRPITRAVPGAEITVIGLRAGLTELHRRIRHREAGRDPTWYLNATTRLVDKLRDTRVEDHVLSNEGRSAEAVATEALRLAGWFTGDS